MKTEEALKKVYLTIDILKEVLNVAERISKMIRNVISE